MSAIGATQKGREIQAGWAAKRRGALAGCSLAGGAPSRGFIPAKGSEELLLDLGREFLLMGEELGPCRSSEAVCRETGRQYFNFSAETRRGASFVLRETPAAPGGEKTP